MLLLVLCSLEEQGCNLLKAFLLGLGGKIGVLVAGLGLAGEGSLEVLLGLGSLVGVAGEKLKIIAALVAYRANRGLAVLNLKNLSANLALIESHQITPLAAGLGFTYAGSCPSRASLSPEAPGAHVEQETAKRDSGKPSVAARYAPAHSENYYMGCCRSC